jgi:predicted molibdopterin-dependent oxidoreductase YjgC
VEPPGEARYDWKITGAIASRMGYDGLTYKDSQEIFEEIRKVTPSYAGITYARIEDLGIHWPCPSEDHPGTPILHTAQFTRGKGLFHAIDVQPPAEEADAEYPLYLTTGRLLYQYHTGTMTMKSADLNEKAPGSFVEISAADADRYELADGDMVEVASRRGAIQAAVKISAKAVDGTVFIPFHFSTAAANVLTNAALDPVCGIPEFKVCAVKLSKAA